MNIIIFICLSIIIPFTWCNNNCNDVKNENFHFHLATKTPYRFVENKNVSKLTFPGCTPRQIWMVIRHGTRNPGGKYIRALDRLTQIQQKFLENLSKSTLCFENSKNLQQWKAPSDLLGNEKFLTKEGQKELMELSNRMRQRLPELFPASFSNSSYMFKYTKSQRTEQSAQWFAKGIFGLFNSSQVWYPSPLSKDPILRFYKCCNKWKFDIDKNPESVKERNKFEKSDLVKNLIRTVTERLGLPVNYLEFEDIFYMYSYCAFETAWNDDRKGAWCSVFTISEFEVLEYAEDLEYYWIDGYGFNLTHEQACVMIRDMLHLFDVGIPQSVFYFTHSGTILKLIAHLGLYKDAEHLTHEIKPDRQWRVSKIDAFGSNIGFVKYSCDNSKNPYILLLHQEQPMKIPECSSNNFLCPLDKFIEIQRTNQDFCDFADMCSITTKSCAYNIKWLLEKLYKCFS
ncbi:multiple inositol polyphosphate phosphatase 1-like [Ctenocephalides felis]|uniref:multiple inositol polyphosphate phosphatase 1-like n=1 Tax=Ctenocephalides felis TaxID=7515 RepID=UPI000E6E45F3|nr:multiple inositol polyphosphate phosphatase 1-like [Ctenocephalides felis]